MSIASLQITNSQKRTLIKLVPNAYPCTKVLAKKELGDDALIEFVQVRVGFFLPCLFFLLQHANTTVGSRSKLTRACTSTQVDQRRRASFQIHIDCSTEGGLWRPTNGYQHQWLDVCSRPESAGARKPCDEGIPCGSKSTQKPKCKFNGGFCDRWLTSGTIRIQLDVEATEWR